MLLQVPSPPWRVLQEPKQGAGPHSTWTSNKALLPGEQLVLEGMVQAGLPPHPAASTTMLLLFPWVIVLGGRALPMARHTEAPQCQEATPGRKDAQCHQGAMGALT